MATKKPPEVRTVPAFAFDGQNVNAQRLAKKNAAKMVTNITTETRQALRALVTRAIRDGIPPWDAARLIKLMVGMTSAQAQAAMSYREELINLGHNMSKVDQLVGEYADQKIRERALMIARTETMKALNSGQEESWKQAQKAGLLGPDAMKEWMTSDPCPVCAPMEGVKVRVGESFPIPGPPAHPRCRCTIAPAP